VIDSDGTCHERRFEDAIAKRDAGHAASYGIDPRGMVAAIEDAIEFAVRTSEVGTALHL